MNDNEARDLWAIAAQDESEKTRRRIHSYARAIYISIVALGSIVALDLFAGRVNGITLKLFGVGATLALAASSIMLAFATSHSAAGTQRIWARAFWFLDLCAYLLNIWVDYSLENGWPLNDTLSMWRMFGVVGIVVLAAFGWAIYLSLSPEQELADAQAEQHRHAIAALLAGIKSPSGEARAEFNHYINQAAHHLAASAAYRVFGIVSQQRPAKRIDRRPEPEPVDLPAPHKQSTGDKVKAAMNGSGGGEHPNG